jgi:ribonuclease BN (tRNA processing enzyme)
MKLVLLGTGGYFPTTRRHTACLLLPELGVLLDAGSGMCRLGEYRQTDRLDIFLTHAHLDHVMGLTHLINIVPTGVAQNTTVHGEAPKLAAVREHLFSPLIFPVAPPFRWLPLAENVSLPRGGVLTHFPLRHPGGSIGIRLDWPDRSLAYVTDTTADVDAGYVERIRGVDLLIHEAYFAEPSGDLPEITGHSWLQPVAEVAAKAAVGRLVLVHIDPQTPSDRDFDLETARGIFHLTEIGQDCQQLSF